MREPKRQVHDGYGCRMLFKDADDSWQDVPVTSVEIGKSRVTSERRADAPQSRILPLGLLFLPGMCVLEVRTADGQWHDVKCSRDLNELKTMQAGLRYCGHKNFRIIEPATWPC